MGNGFDKVDLFVDAIQNLIENEDKRKALSLEAVEYIKKVHNVDDFIKNTHAIIKEEIKNK